MNKYVVDLEIAKELKNNGFLQDSKFSWEYDDVNSCDCIQSIDKEFSHFNTVNAPMSDEILKELPKYIDSRPLTIIIANTNIVEYLNIPSQIDEKLSNALAKMWLYLKKEGYIK